VARDQYRLLEAPLAAEGETVVAVGPEPGPGPGPGPEVPPTTGDGEEGGYWSDWHNWAGWGSLGLGVAFGAVGLASSLIIYTDLQEDPSFTTYRQMPEHQSSANVCDDAQNDTEPIAANVRSICDSSTTYEILQGVMYGLAAVGAGLGIYFLVTADDGEEEPESGTALSLTPWGMPGGGGFGLTGTF
jgi:hypothetical protein